MNRSLFLNCEKSFNRCVATSLGKQAVILVVRRIFYLPPEEDKRSVYSNFGRMSTRLILPLTMKGRILAWKSFSWSRFPPFGTSSKDGMGVDVSTSDSSLILFNC